jgi:hypothetical protein
MYEGTECKFIITFVGPQGRSYPVGVNLAHRGELWPLGVLFTPLFTPIQG